VELFDFRCAFSRHAPHHIVFALFDSGVQFAKSPVNVSFSFDFGSAQRDILERAAVLLESGEGERAKQVLSSLQPKRIGNAQEALIATQMLLDVHLLEAALASVERAAELDSYDPEVPELRAECRYRLDLPATLRTEGMAIRTMLERLNATAQGSHADPNRHIHIVGQLNRIGGSERRTLNLHRLLSPHMSTTLWSTLPAYPAYAIDREIRLIAPEAAPAGGTLVLIGTYYPCGDWLENNRFDRVIVCHNLVEDNQKLRARLHQIEKNPARPRVELTFPSKMFRDLLGLPGRAEYSPVDLVQFQRERPAASPSSGLKIGRHGRAFSLKFHPNDPAFFRQLLARGHQVKILGGTVIARAFSRDTGTKPDLIEAGTLGVRDFLTDLDVFLYRKHPQWLETGGSVILEAMAMEVPVIVFPEQCGCAELIVHGENGFLVSSEAEALAIIERLQASPDLRKRIGSGGRRTMVELQQWHEQKTLAYYRDGYAAGE
jgi:glycosyltransferase involved in cell wall biosynthesis